MIGDIDWAHPLNRQHPMALGAKAILLGSPNHRGTRWYDLTANRNHGTLRNMHPASDWVRGPEHGTFALHMAGSGERVSLGTITGAPAGHPIAISCWVKHDTTHGIQSYFVGRQAGSHDIFLRSENGSVACYINANGFKSADSGAVTIDKTWHHIVGQYTGSAIEVYIDGVLVGIRLLSGSMTPVGVGNNIGSNAGGSGDYMQGTIAAPIVYRRGLSLQQIKWLYDNPGLEPMLNKIEPTRKAAPVTGGGGSGFNPAWAMNSTVVAGVNCA